MTRVGTTLGGAQWNPAAEGREDGLSAHPERRNADTGGDGLGTGMRFGQTRHPAHSFGDREEAFSEKMRLELQKDLAGGEEEPARLLAVAVAVSPLPGPQPAPAGNAAPQPGQPDRIAAVADRIEQALKAERAAIAGDGGVSLRLSIPDQDGGIGAVTLTMTAQTIEVVLTPAGTAGENDIVAAAQLLAERLQARFSRRAVRILEATAGQSAEAGGHMSEISRLLDRRETPR